MNVMLIGGAGFIGSHIIEQLEDVNRIVVYDNFCRGSMDNISKECEVMHSDILHTDVLNDAMKDMDVVIHLAALWLLHCHEYPESAFDVNIRGTFNVLNACVKNDVKKLIYSSSASVYGDALNEPMNENHPYNNETFYGASKIAGEHMLKAFHYKYGLNYTGLRYFNVYGPRQDYKGAYVAVMMKVIDNILKGISPVVYGDGNQAYDFIHVCDIARANICAIENDNNNFYNVCTGKKTSIKKLTEIILKIMDSDLSIEYKDVDGETFVTNRVGDSSKAKNELGFEYSIDIKEGMKDLIEWRMVENEKN